MKLLYLLQQTAPFNFIALIGVAISMHGFLGNRVFGPTDKSVISTQALIEVLPWLGMSLTLTMIVMMIVGYEAPRD